MLLQLCKNCLLIEQMVDLKVQTHKATLEDIIKLQNEILDIFLNYNANCLIKIKLIGADVKERLHSFNYCLQQFSKFSECSIMEHRSNFFNLTENYRERLKLSLDVFDRDAKSTTENLQTQMSKLTQLNDRLFKNCETLKNECFEIESNNFEISQRFLNEFKVIKKTNEKQIEIINEKMKTNIKQVKNLDELKIPKEQIVQGEQTLALLKSAKAQMLKKIKNFNLNNKEEKDKIIDLKKEVARVNKNEEKLQKRFCLDFEGFQNDLKVIAKNIESFEKTF